MAVSGSPQSKSGDTRGQERISAQMNEENGKPVTRNDPELEEWKQAYLRYLDTLEGAGQYAYSLIYVDDDEIPELAVDYGFDDMGVRVDGGCRAVWHFAIAAM